MSTTTIKVRVALRDRLAALARARGQTMGALLEDIAERIVAEERAAAVSAAYARLASEDPAAWRAYLDELEAWEGAHATDAGAALEWPEYNQPAGGP